MSSALGDRSPRTGSRCARRKTKFLANSRQAGTNPSTHAMEGGTVCGHAGVRQYWTRQWTMINRLVGSLQFRREETNRTKAVVHQVGYHTDLQSRSPGCITHCSASRGRGMAKQKGSTRNGTGWMGEGYPFRTLPDYLQPGLALAFVGTNPRLSSVPRAHYFARLPSRLC